MDEFGAVDEIQDDTAFLNNGQSFVLTVASWPKLLSPQKFFFDHHKFQATGARPQHKSRYKNNL